jgi:hypothetical protein
VNRRIRAFPLEELLLAQLAPGFLLAAGWTVMYEVYHEDGSYYTTLMQEILSTEGLFPYFILSALLMAFPLGLIVDTVRQVVGEGWLGVPRGRGGKVEPDPALDWLGCADGGAALSTRYLLYRHARATVLAPAKAAGNMAVVLLVFLAWFVVKIIRIEGWTVFSLAFIFGTPLVGLGLVAILLARYAAGLRDFARLGHDLLSPAGAPSPPHADIDPTAAA